MKYKIALLQIAGKELDPDFNLAKGLASCRQAKELGADLALFPEMWNINYASCPADREGKDNWEGQAIDQASGFFQAFVHLAQQLEMAIAITYLERFSPKPRNTVAVINSKGEVALHYSKVFLCDFGQPGLRGNQCHPNQIGADYNCTPGKEFPVCTLTGKEGSVRIGAMICADREFPEAATSLMKNGAELIIVPNCCNWDDIRNAQLKTRAFDNLVGVAMANYPEPKANGHSIAYDCLAFDRDPLIIEADEEEGIFMAVFDLAQIRKFRKQEQWRLDYRLGLGLDLQAYGES